MTWKQLQNGSDIRGVAIAGVADEPVNLTPERIQVLGRSFVAWLRKQDQLHQENSHQENSHQDQTERSPVQALKIAVGRDSRLSGPTLMPELVKGMAQMGCQVMDFGLASTPAMFVSTVNTATACDGAIMMTASHLPFNRNGLKFFTPKGGLDKKDIAAILELAAQNDSAQEDSAQPLAQNGSESSSGAVSSYDFMSVYADGFVQMVREAVNHPTHFDQPLKGLHIVVDAGNGAGGFYAGKVLQPLGADTTGSQFLDPDGHFPNHIPNPEDATAIASLRQAVLDQKADFGIIFDTDVDRSAAVDAAGHELNRNRLIALISAVVLREHPGSTIVTDSITSDGLTQFIEKDLGGIHHRFKRGYKNVINESKRLNAEGQDSWLAIETSGHAAMKENYFLDDGAYLITKLLVELAKTKLEGRSLTDLIAPLQEPAESVEVRFKIGTDDFKSYGNQVIEALSQFAEIQEHWTVVPKNYEGVRIACGSPEQNGWFLLRLSLHDPVIPVNIESNVEGGVARIATCLRTFLQAWENLDIAPLNKLLG